MEQLSSRHTAKNNYIANLDCEFVENALTFVVTKNWRGSDRPYSSPLRPPCCGDKIITVLDLNYRYKQPVALPDPKTEWAEETQFISSGWGTRRRNIPGICSLFHSGQYAMQSKMGNILYFLLTHLPKVSQLLFQEKCTKLQVRRRRISTL